MWSNRDRIWDVKIDIFEDNGIYLLGGFSATGKSWLCKELNKMSVQYDDVVGYDLDDKKDSINNKIKRICKGKDPKVIMFDRFDMYDEKTKQDAKHVMQEYRDKAIILVDVKDDNEFKEDEYDNIAGMVIDELEIGVGEWYIMFLKMNLMIY